MCIDCYRRIPHFGPSLQAPFKEYLRAQKAKLHHKQGVGQASVRRQTGYLLTCCRCYTFFVKICRLLVATANLVFWTVKWIVSHAKPLMCQLHWLPVPQ